MAELLALNDIWNGAEGVNDEGVAVMVRYRPGLENFVNTGQYDVRVDITWSYDEAESAFMPSPGELEVMEDMENALVNALETDRLAVLAFVFTGQGERVWSWYSSNIKVTGERLTKALAKFETLPLRITRTNDPDWEEYFDFIEEFEEEG